MVLFFLLTQFFPGSVSELLPQNYSNKVVGVLQFKEPFRFSFAIHCRSLLDDFREDLEFRFSLGLTQLIRRFMMLRSNASDGGGRERMFGGGNMVSRLEGPGKSSNQYFCRSRGPYRLRSRNMRLLILEAAAKTL